MTAVAPPAAVLEPQHAERFSRRVLPAATVATCSALLFLVEPLAAKLLLPLYGGSAAVWTGSVLFFQVVLLAGYACVHTLLRLRPAQSAVVSWLRLGGTVVLLLLPVLVLPLHLPTWAAPGSRSPVFWLLLVLTVLVGLPFLALSVAGPLVSSWMTSDERRHPYRLYAASNAGGLVGLLAYPLVGEPLFGLDTLRRVWSVAYLVAVVLILACAVVARASQAVPAAPPNNVAPDDVPAEQAAPEGRADRKAERRALRRQRLGWLALAALPVSLMLGTTTVLTTDVAPVPLLWVVPLGIYLLTLAIAFAPARERAQPPEPTPAAAGIPPGLLVAVALAAVGLTHALVLPNLLQVLVDLIVLTVGCLAAHRRLAAVRPPTPRLTEFYLLVATGGALGGVWNSLGAPLLFVRPAEYPLAMLAAIALLVVGPARAAREQKPTVGLLAILGELLAFVVPLIFVLLAHHSQGRQAWGVLLAIALVAACWWSASRWPLPLAFGIAGILLVTTFPVPPPVAAGRNFYGSYTVNVDSGRRLLTEGTTVHGWQNLAADRRDIPTSYYAPGGPIGQVFKTYRTDPALRSVSVVGLGIGTLAAYGQPGQSMTFYELDPQIESVARNPALFSFLSDSKATTSVVVGDGRLNLAKAPAHSTGLLVLDAFASDAIPTHLLTTEAFRIYDRLLTDDGMIAVHITNRYLDLVPVLAAAARHTNSSALLRSDTATGDPGRSASQWVVLARQPARLDALRQQPGWQPLPAKPSVAWTDDSSSLLSLFRLHGSR